ncbi:MAG: hydrogenase 4 subunit B [Xanthomonadales bacterium]|nr:hydrogenase 4 subunit B [Xanthomonadales bacterium]
MLEPGQLLKAILGVAGAWFALGLLGLAYPQGTRYVARVLFPLGALAALVLAGLALAAIAQPAATMTLPVGLPDLPVHLRLDALSALFLLLLGVATAGISIFAAGYFREGQGTAPGLLCLQYHVFLASMVLVLLADDAYAFMVAWETMALSSYFLVTTQHRLPEIRSAGFLYLLIAHVGAIGILLGFGVMQGGSWQFTFEAMRGAELSPAWASVAFGLMVFGFGAKAGLLPVHVWLPEAHPAAPSPVSALMSGVMLKTAIYGVLRVSFDLLPAVQWWWGGVLLALGLATAAFGVVYAAVQSDMKRLLAYSSIENIGILYAGIGLTIVFSAFELGALAALALAATLYHALNHACFKSLLFLVTGSVLHATRERSLGRLGGLMRSMPWVAWLGLVGTLAIAGLPPLNGFVSEWLLLQSFLFTPTIPQTFANMLIPVGAAVLALVAALSAYVMVKFYGVIFLGQPREPQLAQAHDCGRFERIGLAWLAALCIALGLMPVWVLELLAPVTAMLAGATVEQHGASVLWLAPTAPERASYAPLLFLAGTFGVIAASFLVVRALFRVPIRRAPPWDCGYPAQTPRMQDSAEGFGQPIRHMFGPVFRMRRQLPAPEDTEPRYAVTVEDRFWFGLYEPLARAVQWLAEQIGRLQQGRISTYLLYSFVTLAALLLIVL